MFTSQSITQSVKTFQITLLIRDNDIVDINSLDGGDIKLFDAQGMSRKIRFLNQQKINNADGSYIQAKYRIAAPGGTGWSASFNGTYQVRLQSKQIADKLGNFATARVLGTIDLNIA